MKVKIFLIVAIVCVFAACSTKHELKIPEKSEIYRLATLVILNDDTSKINIEDYFSNESIIDSVGADESFVTEFSKDKKMLSIIIKDESKVPFVSELKVWINGCAYSIVLKKSKKIKIKMTFKAGKKSYKQVQLAGDFNNWNPKNTEMIFANDLWSTEILLNPGKYSYQMVIDGKWFLDHANKDSSENGMGGYNSVLKVGNSNKENVPFLTTKKFENSQIIISAERKVDHILAMWENYKIPEKFITQNINEFSISIPSNAKKIKRSYLRVWTTNSDGMSNDLFIPLENGKPVLNSADIMRSDIESQIIYFMLVDRFNNGNVKNDGPINDPEVDPKANYMGGDLAGITQKIKQGYFSSLGVNTIWLTPIHQNPLKAYKEFPEPHRKYSGYHGYWPTAITKIDHRFGTADEFKSLVTEAHSGHLNVLLDYVANHLHEESSLFKSHPNWATPLNLPDGRKNIRLWDENRLTTWFDTFLPTLDLAKPEVYEPITDSVLYWVKTYKFDGFRHDATKHVPEIFWRVLTKKLKNQILIPENKHFYQIGETYGSRELIGSYINSGELDAQFDFNLYFDLRTVFGKDEVSFEKLKNSLMESLEYYGYHHLMGNVTGNHDQSRFISLAGGGLKWEENDKEAAWQREVGVGSPVGYKKLQMLTAFITTIPGIPIIYYGDEFGMPGANDPDNRRMMKFSGLNEEENATKKIAEKLIHLRKNNLALIYGDLKFIESSEKTMVYSRTYFGKSVIVAFNKSPEEKHISFEQKNILSVELLKSNFGSKLKIDDKKIDILIPAYSFEIITN